MSERERWIVYPLLFLALGAALRDKLLKQSVADKIYGEQIVCETLTVVDEQGRATAHFEDGTLQLERLRANEVQAANLPMGGVGDGGGGSSVLQMLDLLRRAGVGITARPLPPKPEPDDAEPPPAEPPAEPPTTAEP